MKNLIKGFNSQLDQSEERISEFRVKSKIKQIKIFIPEREAYSQEQWLKKSQIWEKKCVFNSRKPEEPQIR